MAVGVLVGLSHWHGTLWVKGAMTPICVRHTENHKVSSLNSGWDNCSCIVVEYQTIGHPGMSWNFGASSEMSLSGDSEGVRCTVCGLKLLPPASPPTSKPSYSSRWTCRRITFSVWLKGCKKLWIGLICWRQKGVTWNISWKTFRWEPAPGAYWKIVYRGKVWWLKATWQDEQSLRVVYFHQYFINKTFQMLREAGKFLSWPPSRVFYSPFAIFAFSCIFVLESVFVGWGTVGSKIRTK